MPNQPGWKYYLVHASPILTFSCVEMFSVTLFNRPTVGLSLQSSTSSKSRSPFRSRPLATRPTLITPRKVRVAGSFCSLLEDKRDKVQKKQVRRGYYYLFFHPSKRSDLPDIPSPLLVSVGAIRVGLRSSLFLFIKPVRDSLESSLCVRHHVLNTFQLLLSWVDSRMFGHDMTVSIHKDTH